MPRRDKGPGALMAEGGGQVGVPQWWWPVPRRAGLACFLSSQQPLQPQEVLSGQKWQAQEQASSQLLPRP